MSDSLADEVRQAEQRVQSAEEYVAYSKAELAKIKKRADKKLAEHWWRNMSARVDRLQGQANRKILMPRVQVEADAHELRLALLELYAIRFPNAPAINLYSPEDPTP